MNVPVDSDIDNIVDTLHTVGHGVIGTPEMAIRHIERIQELSGGVGTFLIEHASWASHAHTRSSLELFASEVAPHFTGSTRARQAAYTRELVHDQLTRRTMAKAQAAADLQHATEVREQRQRTQFVAAAERALDTALGERLDEPVKPKCYRKIPPLTTQLQRATKPYAV